MDRTQNSGIEVVDEAISRGLNYLWSLNKDGAWSGLPTLAGESDIWVSGFVLAHILHLSDNTQKVKVAQEYIINARQPHGGWSYSSIVPPDADSTAWCLMALASYPNMKKSTLQEARTFLWSHYSDCGISTFSKTSRICEFIEKTAKISIAGWTSTHNDVSVAAALADIENVNTSIIIEDLLRIMATNGFLSSYWWRGPLYSTALFCRALYKLNLLLPDKVSERMISTIIQGQLPEGGFQVEASSEVNAFNTALALESFCHLSFLGHRKERMNCGKALLRSQQNHGGWEGGLNMRIPVPDDIEPDINGTWDNPDGGGNSYISDKDGLFATALACYALDSWRRCETQSKLPIEGIERKDLSMNPN